MLSSRFLFTTDLAPFSNALSPPPGCRNPWALAGLAPVGIAEPLDIPMEEFGLPPTLFEKVLAAVEVDLPIPVLTLLACDGFIVEVGTALLPPVPARSARVIRLEVSCPFTTVRLVTFHGRDLGESGDPGLVPWEGEEEDEDEEE